jgi:hypothetical protein
VAASGCKWLQVAASGCERLQATAFSKIKMMHVCSLSERKKGATTWDKKTKPELTPYVLVWC